MASTHPTQPPTSRSAWHIAMWIIRPAAAGMAGWSLYIVATHYGVPAFLAVFASVVFDGIALACLYQATEAVRAGRSAAAPILATLGVAGSSVYLNTVHARLVGGGTPATVLFALPTVGLLAVSALSWSATRATARAARGESPMRLPAFGLWGWILARTEATEALKARAVAHVTSDASPAHHTAPAVRLLDNRAILREKFAAMDPADAIEIAADSHPAMDPAELAELLTTYGISVDALQVALVLGRAATPSVTLDRMPAPDPAPLPSRSGEQPAIGVQMRASAPQVKAITKADAITVLARHFGPSASPDAIVRALAHQGIEASASYVRSRLSIDRRKAQATQAKQEVERSNGTGFYP